MDRSPPHDASLLASKPHSGELPLTVAIPHYRHRRHLEVVIASLLEQNRDDFEILISDDASPDDSREVLPQMLSQSGRPFSYYLQHSNLGYDGNVRFCLSAARGRHVLLLGNDDALKGPAVVEDLLSRLRDTDWPEVAVTNFSPWDEPAVTTRRATKTGVLGSGPQTALSHFRSLSFVSGLIFSREAARRHETDRWDSSIYYQIYLGCRIVAGGGRIAAIDVDAILKDVRVEGHKVPTYASRLASREWTLRPRHTGLDSVVRVTADAILPMIDQDGRSRTLRSIGKQILTLNYPFWVMEYRRLGNISAGVGVARDLWPGRLLKEYELTVWDRAALWCYYAGGTLFSLLLPPRVLMWANSKVAPMVRRRAQETVGEHHTSSR